jgi:hypothetical protein
LSNFSFGHGLFSTKNIVNIWAGRRRFAPKSPIGWRFLTKSELNFSKNPNGGRNSSPHPSFRRALASGISAKKSGGYVFTK